MAVKYRDADAPDKPWKRRAPVERVVQVVPAVPLSGGAALTADQRVAHRWLAPMAGAVDGIRVRLENPPPAKERASIVLRLDRADGTSTQLTAPLNGDASQSFPDAALAVVAGDLLTVSISGPTIPTSATVAAVFRPEGGDRATAYAGVGETTPAEPVVAEPEAPAGPGGPAEPVVAEPADPVRDR